MLYTVVGINMFKLTVIIFNWKTMNLYISSFLCLSKNEYMSSLLHITMERPQRMQNLQKKFVIFFAQSICACV